MKDFDAAAPLKLLAAMKKRCGNTMYSNTLGAQIGDWAATIQATASRPQKNMVGDT